MDDSDRAQGYVTDTTYEDTFFRELSPVWLHYVAMPHGVGVRSLDQPITGNLTHGSCRVGGVDHRLRLNLSS